MPRATPDRTNAIGAGQIWPAGVSREIGIFLTLAFGFAWLLWGYWVIAMPSGGLVISPAFIACAIIGGLAPTLSAIAVSALKEVEVAVDAILAVLGDGGDLLGGEGFGHLASFGMVEGHA